MDIHSIISRHSPCANCKLWNARRGLGVRLLLDKAENASALSNPNKIEWFKLD